MGFCPQPFDRIEIYENGDVYNCCPPFINYYSIGNIYNESFEKIWNSSKAQELRKKIMNGDFSYCADICNRKNSDEQNTLYNTAFISEFPTEINISTDNICNVKCTICRDFHYKPIMSDNEFISKIDEIFIPIFKNAKHVRFGCSGEPFASIKEKALIKRVREIYPKIKFHFHTNGILADEKLLNELNIYSAIDTMTVSIHSATKKTYKRIVRGGNYERLHNNLSLYSKMHKEGLINSFRLIFVVYSENYTEMPLFINMAAKYNAAVEFWAYRKNETEIGKNYEKYSIIDSIHPEYNKFIKLLKTNIFNNENVKLYPELENLRNANL